MNTKEDYFRTALREELARRQRSNPAYSLRSFAKQLGMQAPTLSAVLAGKRPLPSSTAAAIPEKLSFSPAEKKRFLNSVYYRKAPPAIAKAILDASAANSADAAHAEKTLREELHFKIIAEWEHYAVLTLAETRGFRADKAWIAKRLRISEARAQTALNRLMEAGLLSVDAIGRVRLHQVNVTTSDDAASAALRQSHREALLMGAEKLDSVPVELRDFSSMTIAVSLDRLPEAKKLVRAFERQLSDLLEDGKRTEVYQVCVQLYPLTETQDRSGGST